jgi:hypothetical protein
MNCEQEGDSKHIACHMRHHCSLRGNGFRAATAEQSHGLCLPRQLHLFHTMRQRLHLRLCSGSNHRVLFVPSNWSSTAGQITVLFNFFFVGPDSLDLQWKGSDSWVIKESRT